MKINSSLSKYMTEIDGLRTITRYNTAAKVSQESVAEHSYYVAAYVVKLNEFYQFDEKKALEVALLHDAAEVFISDVPHPIKAAFPKLAEELDKAEYQVNVDHFSKELADDLEEFNTLSTAEGVIVALADIMSVLSYAKYEIKLGNSEYMRAVYAGAFERLQKCLKAADPYLREGFTTPMIEELVKDFSNGQLVITKDGDTYDNSKRH